MPVSEDRVKNAVVGYIANQGYSNGLKIKSESQHGVDISANHRDNVARRVAIEAKGDSDGQNKTVAILMAWGELLSRLTAINPNRIHGLAFPESWENNVAKLSSSIVAKQMNVHYYFVDDHGNVTEYTAHKFHDAHPKTKPKVKRSRKKSK